ncbi:hypothetical protein P3T36_002288 [Kitasatospora sp. MAP12-15]|uniref:AfsA-related hotdog domain-containing protein n=1 Tax=unclassified Kitasatospora TaxID=2633591 RepID=UPI002474C4D5|nr:AfsA-related hotdog domain-containing protein [Kitasatospora sp. MAP12-44]MDH6108791.1 hypothetical protein [Kitasatospora sp. MAP12-44]
MTSLQTVPSAIRPRTVLPSRELGGGRSCCLLEVDQAHPFFFDHPLDHLPAMLLLAAQLDALEGELGDPVDSLTGRRLRAEIGFAKMAELDGEPILLDCEPAPAALGGGWEVTGTQQGSAVADGLFQLTEQWRRPRPPSPVSRPARYGQAPSEPVQQRPVHRVDRENVMLGTPVIGDGWMRAAAVAPHAGHYLRQRAGDGWGIEELVEIARQFVTAAWHLVHHWPVGTQLILQQLSFELPIGLDREPPLQLHGPSSPPRVGRGTFDIELLSGESEEPVGRLTLVVCGVSGAAYQRLRERTRAAGRTR